MKEIRREGGRLIDYHSELDPDGDFQICDLEDQTEDAVEEAFMEYLSTVHGIEPEEFI